jgi:ribonuclease HII
MNLYEYEEELYKNGCKYIAGVDEVGRGPLVGPVVSACVILPFGFAPDGLNDSKKLTEKQRDKFFDIIKDNAVAIGIGVVSPEEIDRINIYEASKESMMMAIKDCNHKIDHVLIDAMKLKLEVPSTSIIKGDSKSISIAAASVIAKVTRDRMMYELDKKYPMYGYGKHKGYPTKKHIEAINKYGLIEGYRKTYKPVMDYINSH